MGKKTKIALAIAAASAAVWAGTKAVAKPQKREDKDVLSFTRPIVLAHHGGAHLAPEHSMLAFEKAVQYGVDGFKVDVRLTKDEEIILFHDASTERLTGVSSSVKDLTLAELRELNIGENFECLEGNYPYKNEQVEVVTLRELLETFPEKVVYIDIKDAPDTYEGSLMPSKLWRLLEELQATNRVIVSSNYSEQADRFNLYAQNRVALGAGDADITKAYTSFTSQFGHLFNPKVDVFEVPLKSNVMNFDSPKFIKFLSDLNCHVLYTEINDLVTMSRLVRSGATGIITDRPDIAETLLKKYVNV
ncbi:glycerophosphodiester phosphodiesterase family protein [Lysinibacillus sp. KU-BSD001]|uniref:glycerophosphodiester phosphodiesterase family protein n=1 Tax=Lysinibacillus sp. KU-BSD001 TaxID=3141328 RepID=UPI0036EC8CB1